MVTRHAAGEQVGHLTERGEPVQRVLYVVEEQGVEKRRIAHFTGVTIGTH